MEYILGISAFYHDSAACLIGDGEIIAAVQEERFTRKKHDASFPVNSIKFCMECAGIDISDISFIAFYEKPFLKFERLLETYYAFAPKGGIQFVKAIPVWIKEKLFIKKIIKEKISEISGKKFPDKLKILFPEHHLSHAASAFFPSPFEKSAILTLDGVGEWATASLGIGQGNKIKLIYQLNFPSSVGLLYSAFTYYCGFRVNSGEYKLMGLAPYGNPYSEKTKKYIRLIKEKLVEIKEDGSIRLNMDYFAYATGDRMVYDKKWKKLFGFPPRKPESKITEEYMNLSYAIQNVLEEIVFKMAKFLKSISGEKYLTISGGVGLNCVANGKLLKERVFEDIWVQPAATDAGGALGAAYAVWYIYLNKKRVVNGKDSMKGALLGPSFSSEDIEKVLKKYNAVYEEMEFEQLIEKVAGYLAEGKVVGWFRGRMEFGPRALGNRSILADARNPEIQQKLNLKIKFRESFRPFAPSVLWEDTQKFFETDKPSPYMLFIAYVKKERRKHLPENYHSLPLKEKLYHIRSDIPAITHLDFSARLQTVHRDINPEYYRLIEEFKKQTGYGIVVNTSFNVRGEPIVCTPEEAFICFIRTEMDVLVMENFLLLKENQPEIKIEKPKYEKILD